MSHLLGLRARFSSIFVDRGAEARMDEEFRFHLDMATRANVGAGMTEADARRVARLAFGGADRHREDMRDGRGARWMRDLWSDVRYAMRSIAHAPGLAITVAATLGLGIGLNGVVASMVSAVLFRPLPVERPSELVALYGIHTRTSEADNVGYEDYLDFRDRTSVFSGLAAIAEMPMNVRVDRLPEVMWGQMVSENYFTVLQMRPAVGRFFDETATAGGDEPVAVVSFDAWKGRFNGDPGIIHRAIWINGTQFSIIGVAAAGFHGTRKFGYWPDIWVPLGMHAIVNPVGFSVLRGRGAGWAMVVGRLQKGVTLEQGRQRVTTLAHTLETEHSETNLHRGALLLPAGQGSDNPTYLPPRAFILASSLAIFAGVLVLIVVCASLTSVFLARAAARDRELAIRLALGCSRGRLIRQLVAETVVVALPSAAIAAGVIFAAPALQVRALPRMQFHVGFGIAPSAGALVYTMSLALVAVLLLGLVPSIRASRPDLVQSLKASGAVAAGGRVNLRACLVVAQLALSVMLMIAAGLFVRSLAGARTAPLDFEPSRRALVSINLDALGYDSVRGRALFRDIRSRVAGLAGVESVSSGFPVPFDSYGHSTSLFVDGDVAEADAKGASIATSVVDRAFFSTLGVLMEKGREFAEMDSVGVPLRIIVNTTMWRRYWPNRDPVGNRVRVGGPNGPEAIVVGVVPDVKFAAVDEASRSHAYFALSQTYRGWQTLVVHTRDEPERLLAQIRAAVQAADPLVPTFGIGTMDAAVSSALYSSKLAASLSGFFAALTAMISSIGLYGLVANGVASRTRELGLRMALGSNQRQILSLILGATIRLGAIGIALGTLGGALLGKILSRFLVGLSPFDPITFSTVPVALLTVIIVAGSIPAMRGARLSPADALRD